MSKSNTYWRDPALGEQREFEVASGRMRAYVAGTGEPLVFVHGALVNANLWRKVVARLSPDFQCICLEMPLGSHEIPMPERDMLDPTAIADLIPEAVQALGLEQPTVIGNDSGGGLTQIALSRNPEFASRLVLTSCDAYENFPPRFFDLLLYPLRYPAIGRALFAPMRLRAPRNAPIAFGWLQNDRLDPQVGDSYVRPLLSDKGAANDIARALKGINPSYTMAAIEKLRSWDRPALIAWSREDKFFPVEHGEKLAADLPNARLELIDGARTFSAEDRPERLAELIAEFVREPVSEPA